MKTYVTKPITVQAIQMTKEMLNGDNLPDHVYVIRGRFYDDALEGPAYADPGDWYVVVGGHNWFVTKKEFEANYTEVK